MGLLDLVILGLKIRQILGFLDFGMAKLKGRTLARRRLIAGRILEIFAAGGGYREVEEEFGKPRDPVTRKKWNVEQVLGWALEAYLGEDAKRLTAARVKLELERVAFSDLRELYRDGELIDPSEWGDGVAAAVASVETKEKGVVKVTRWDKLGALKALGAASGMNVGHGDDGGGGSVRVVIEVRDPTVRVEAPTIEGKAG